MEDHGFEIIDVHHHYEAGYGVGDSLDVGRKGSNEDKAALELKTRLSTMDEDHVSQAIILAGHTYLRPHGLADTRAVNDAVAAYCGQEPSRFLAGVGVIEPLYGPAGYAEAKRCKEELGFVGITFHNGFQGTPVDSPLMVQLVEKIGEAGLVPFVHAFGTALENLYQVDQLARHFPDLNMIVLDAFYEPNQVRAMADIAERRPNLYFDLALLVTFESMALPVVRAVGADRFLFGTDQYSWPMMTKPFGCALSGILASELSDKEKNQIFNGNIKRLLGR